MIRLLPVFLCCAPLIAIWFPGELVPVDRLLIKATEDLRQHPDDAARERTPEEPRRGR